MFPPVAEPESSLPRSQQPVKVTDPKSDKFHVSEKRNTEGSRQKNEERKQGRQQREVPEEEFRVLLTEIGLNDVAYNSRLNEVKSMRDDPSSGRYGATSYTNISCLIGTAGVWTKSHQNE
jgi:hypothetical protein